MRTPAPGVTTLIADLREVFGARLAGVVTYAATPDGHGDVPTRCLALVDAVGPVDLDACARRATAWRKAGLAVPLVLPTVEFRQSLDAFPLEYGAIIRQHEVVFGPSPFDGVSIDTNDLRRACETQVKSHVVHLRQGYIEAGGSPRAVADLVVASAPAFAALLRHVAWLQGVADAGVSVSRAGAHAAGLPEPVVDAVLALEHPRGLTSGDAARLFPEYLGAVEQLARFIDGWNR